MGWTAAASRRKERCIYENPHFRTGTPERFTVEQGLNLEELAQKTGISKSALGSYENDNDEYKEINHGSLLKLADFYQVSVDYLLGLTNNRKYENTPIEELHLSDEVVELLKSERFNNRLLCEIISHEKFKELLADAEIYVDGMATMRFHDMNSSLAAVRAMILENIPKRWQTGQSKYWKPVR